MATANTIRQRRKGLHALPKGAAQLNRGLREGKWLRFTLDRAPFASALGAAAFQFWAYWTAQPIYWLLPVLFTLRWLHLVQHNHVHLGLFRSKGANEAFGWILGFAGGVPMAIYREQHVLTHHTHNHSPDDYTGPFSFPGSEYPFKPVNFWYYILTYGMISLKMSLIKFRARPKGSGARALRRHVMVAGSIGLLLLWRDPLTFALYYPFAWGLMYCAGGANNWSYHDGCLLDSVYTSANTDLTLLCRRVGFNIGFHAAHHWYPSLHWSQLEIFHRRYLSARYPESQYRPISPQAAKVDMSPLCEDSPHPGRHTMIEGSHDCPA